MRIYTNICRYIPICLMTLMLTACNQPPEVIARDSIAGAKSFLDTEKSHHPECTASTTGICGILSRATGVKDTAIDALEAYCSGPSFDNGGACNPPAKGSPAATQALTKLTAAVTNLNLTISDVKKAEGK